LATGAFSSLRPVKSSFDRSLLLAFLTFTAKSYSNNYFIATIFSPFEAFIFTA